MELGIRSSGPTAEGLVIYAIGFDISTPAQAANMAAKSDGAIVGSAIVKLCAQYGADCVMHVADYVKEMAQAVHAL